MIAQIEQETVVPDGVATTIFEVTGGLSGEVSLEIVNDGSVPLLELALDQQDHPDGEWYTRIINTSWDTSSCIGSQTPHLYELGAGQTGRAKLCLGVGYGIRLQAYTGEGEAALPMIVRAVLNSH